MKRRTFYFALAAVILTVFWASKLNAQNTSRFHGGVWTCWNFEEHHRVTVGSHPDIILFVDTPATDISDRRVCVFAEER